MKQSILIFYLALFVSFLSRAQYPFIKADTSLVQTGNSYAAWGDFDNDGDLDVALTGDDAGITLTQVYRNDSSVFTMVSAGLPGVNFSSCEWGDYDNDGDLDLLVTGYNDNGNAKTYIIKNQNGAFSESGILLPGIAMGQATWGDFDNDGDLDILMAGNGISVIYRNDGNDLFTDFPSTFLPVWGSFCNWVDYNNDGRLDAFIAGDAGIGMYSNLYRNDGDTFTLVNINPEPFLGLGSGHARWADLDLDGWNDLLITGMDFYGDGHVLIYQNQGNDQFTLIGNYDFQVKVSSVDIGDYDADGLPDWILMGRIPGCGGTAVTMLYHNEGFMLFFDVNTNIQGYKNGSASFGDYNNDGYSDLLITGLTGFDEPRTILYRNTLGNQSFTMNTPPLQPSGLTAAMDATGVTLSWQRSSDQQTPSPGISYNLFIGNDPELSDVFSPMADITSGFRHLASMGNASQDTGWLVTGLGPGLYYWSVQAIDNGFLASVFAPVESFEVTATGTPEHINGSKPEVIPNPATHEITIKTTFPADATICDQHSRVVWEGKTGRIDISSWPSGIYLVKVAGDPVFQTAKFLKR